MKKTKGFSLIEVLLAMMILSGGVLLLANSWSGSFLRIRKTQTATEVAALLERKIVELEVKYKGKPLEGIPEEESDDFGSDYPQYRWQMTSKEFELPDLSAGLTARDGGANEMFIQLMRTLTEHLKKTVKEIKVSVFYKVGDKELEYSVTTFFVDYDKEIPAPGMAL